MSTYMYICRHQHKCSYITYLCTLDSRGMDKTGSKFDLMDKTGSKVTGPIRTRPIGPHGYWARAQSARAYKGTRLLGPSSQTGTRARGWFGPGGFIPRGETVTDW